MAKTIATPTFAEVVKEAISLRREADRLNAKPVKLRADAFVTEACEQAGLSRSEALAVRVMLDERPEDFRETFAARRRMKSAIKEPTMRRAKFRRPVWNAYVTPEAVGELAAEKLKPAALWAVAALDLAEHDPDVFGTCEDVDAHDARVEALRTRLEELYARIETGFTGDDVMFLDTSDLMRREGYTAMGYKLSGGVVRCGVGSGKHLVDWLLAHPEQIP